ncbi:sulfotransferase family 2 domain-containing protein [Nodosilinea sp. PGN35]|uniref:sulfotransferase family 2 domain-containing protein n=1 Tax=Nodosilinea sp. PGN35 TaxID=3020489 RepID=UPI0023B312D1|nr:sulfotransferase family 2 domain-containing protein [Nodosilinea sp. TSF1-S3]MDF0368161.1 sulfotransferase family 2 domain-containing protein [Nodosilinea sp. TSF1-S3]
MSFYSRLPRRVQTFKLKQPEPYKGAIPSQFKRDKVIFIHIPKCAGSAFLDSYLGYQLGHAKASQYFQRDSDFFYSSFVFSFVRHPVDRFISAYNFIQSNTLWSYLPSIKERISLYGSDIEEFSNNLSKTSEVLDLPWFEPQYKYLEIDGSVAVNRAFKTETFFDDLKVLQKEVGIHLRSPADINRSSAPKKKPTDILSPKSIKNLESVYERDFTLFGYF